VRVRACDVYRAHSAVAATLDDVTSPEYRLQCTLESAIALCQRNRTRLDDAELAAAWFGVLAAFFVPLRAVKVKALGGGERRALTHTHTRANMHAVARVSRHARPHRAQSRSVAAQLRRTWQRVRGGGAGVCAC
jgi:hypothetical protein